MATISSIVCLHCCCMTTTLSATNKRSVLSPLKVTSAAFLFNSFLLCVMHDRFRNHIQIHGLKCSRGAHIIHITSMKSVIRHDLVIGGDIKEKFVVFSSRLT